jgi:hypothetical protein
MKLKDVCEIVMVLRVLVQTALILNSISSLGILLQKTYLTLSLNFLE